MESNLKTLMVEAHDLAITENRKAILAEAVQRLQEAAVFCAMHKLANSASKLAWGVPCGFHASADSYNVRHSRTKP